MAHHSPAEIDWLELLFFGAQLSRLMLEPPRRMHKPGMRRIHETESGVVGRAGKWQHDGCQWGSSVGKDRHARRLRHARNAFIIRREIDPHQTLPFDARIGSAANLAEIHHLALPQRGDLDAGAAHVEAPAVIATGNDVTVELAVVQGDAAMGANVAQSKDLSIAVPT